MSDYYGVNWGPGGPGSEVYPAQPWAFGDAGPGDDAMFRAFGDADVIWRDMEARRTAAAAQAGPNIESYTHDADTPPSAPRELIPHVPAQETSNPRVEPRPLHRIVTGPGAESMQPHPRPAEPESPAAMADRRRARRLGVGVTVAVVVLAGARIFWPSSETAPVSTPGAGDVPGYTVAPNFTCDVTGINEEDGKGVLYMRDAVDPRAKVTVHGDHLMVTTDQNTVPDTKLTYVIDGMHGQDLFGQQLHVQIQGVDCKGKFTLGKPGAGDESFQ